MVELLGGLVFVGLKLQQLRIIDLPFTSLMAQQLVMKKLKRALFLTHRWLGIVMCAFFFLWFASGIVMMYVEYPELTRDERLKSLPSLDLGSIKHSPYSVVESLNIPSVFSSVSLSSLQGRPAYHFESPDSETTIVFADTAEMFMGADREGAFEEAMLSGFSSLDSAPNYDGLIEIDQWTVTSSLNRHRPLHKVSLGNQKGTTLYISSLTGQVVRDTNRRERFWNWLGSTIHWIYPYQLRKHNELWRDVIVYLSILGLFSVLTGTIIGLLRLRPFKKFKNKSASPYSGWMWWHHVSGLLSVIFVSTFIFSGLMSMGPWGVFQSSSSAQEQISNYTGQSIFRLSSLPGVLLISEESNSPLKEVTWHHIDSEPYLITHYENGDRKAVFNESDNEDNLHLVDLIKKAASQLLTDNRLLSVDLINDFDDFYYARHNSFRPLPIFRARFDDSESTWYHIDSRTGLPISRVTDASRRERWLFNGLHSLDFQILWNRRPLWDFVVVLLSLAGMGFSATSIAVGLRYLRS